MTHISLLFPDIPVIFFPLPPNSKTKTRMNSKICFLLFLVIAAFNVSAQTNYEDVVYLKNGSIIHGIIIEQVPNISIKIKSGPNVFFYKMEEIEKFTKEEIKNEDGGGLSDYGFKKKGFVFNYELGFVDYPAGDDLALLSVMLVHGYQFSHHFSLGVGAGAEISSRGAYNIPAYLDMRIYFLKTRCTPFFNFATGYNLYIASTDSYFYGSSTTTANGFLVNPAFGVRFAINKKVGVTTTLGYKYNGQDSYDGYSHNYFSLHAVTLRWGIIF